MNPKNRVCLLRAQTQAANEIAEIQAESAALAANLLTESLAVETGSASQSQTLIGNVHSVCGRIAELAERERLAQARLTAIDTLLAAFDAAFT